MLTHFEAVEADFQSHYGLDLREVLWGRAALGVRRIRALVSGLPRTGAMVREVAYGGAEWSMTDELLAAVIEVIDYGNRLYFSSHSKKGSTQPKAVVVDRPTATKDKVPEGPRPQTPTHEIWQALGADNVVFEGSDN